MYTLSIEKNISTAHQLRDYEGPCAQIHGHNWKIRIDVQARSTDEVGIVIDFTSLEKRFWKVIGPFDHKLINTVQPFDHINPTAENLAKYIYDQMVKHLPKKISLKSYRNIILRNPTN